MIVMQSSSFTGKPSIEAKSSLEGMVRNESPRTRLRARLEVIDTESPRARLRACLEMLVTKSPWAKLRARLEMLGTEMRYGPRSSSSFCLIPRRDKTVGFGRALARKLASTSLVSWSKEWMNSSDSQSYHPRATPRRVVGKAWHIIAFHVSYKAIYTLNAMTCSVGSKPPSYASNTGRQKCCGIGVSWISWMKGEPQRELSPCSSFIRMILWTSYIR
ncbi:hypothetical protein BHE74_00006318 [Ensete ventricosum]|nr:hypothetical protein BHE74_00006318 [Ensete ventricosum]